MSYKRIQKMKAKMGEALRKPAVKKDSVQTYGVSVSYGPATTVPEEIGRRFKTILLPQVTNICNETESFYNMYATTAHEDEAAAKKQAKELKPVEDLYNILMKAQDIIVNFITSRKKVVTEQTVTPEAGPMNGGPEITHHEGDESELEADKGGDISGSDRLKEVINQIASHNDMDDILSKVQNADEIADALEEALNNHEAQLNQGKKTKEYMRATRRM